MPEMTDFQAFAMVGGWICAGIVLLASVVKTAREGWTFIRFWSSDILTGSQTSGGRGQAEAWVLEQ